MWISELSDLQVDDTQSGAHVELQRVCSVMQPGSSFVGSYDWIGSQEVARALEGRDGIPCIIVAVRSGKEMNESVPRFGAHFEGGGSPYMIGGGSGYALTSRGIQYDDLVSPDGPNFPIPLTSIKPRRSRDAISIDTWYY